MNARVRFRDVLIRGGRMFGSGLKLDKALVTKAKRYADLAGYSSVEEFITHIIERQLEKLGGAESEEEIRKKLKGLGYIS